MSDVFYVIGVDPAPSKKGCAFVKATVRVTGGTLRIDDIIVEKGAPPPKMHGCIEEWKKLPNALIVWDAPLSGPPFPDRADGGFDKWDSAFTMRRIEQWLREQLGEQCEGISVQNYCGCCHWTITRHLIGLPIVGRYDNTVLPFEHLQASEQSIRVGSGSFIVETHPAVAMWAFLDGKLPGGIPNWKYKKSTSIRCQFMEALYAVWDEPDKLGKAVTQKLRGVVEQKLGSKDDLFDAQIAMVLGILLLMQKSAVKIYGDKEWGAMLLPKCERFEIYPERSK